MPYKLLQKDIKLTGGCYYFILLLFTQKTSPYFQISIINSIIQCYSDSFNE